MAPFIKKIVNNHVRVILYYGDVDMVKILPFSLLKNQFLGLQLHDGMRISFLLNCKNRGEMKILGSTIRGWIGTQGIQKINFSKRPKMFKRRLGKTPWKYDKQIGGFKTVYNGLQFVTIRGAG